MPDVANLAIYQGDDYAAVVTVQNGSLPPDLSAYRARAHIRTAPASNGGKLVVDVATVINQNYVTLSIPAAKTISLTKPNYCWDLQLESTVGKIQTILHGSVIVTPHVTV